MALKACVIAGIILLVFALFGEQLLGALHIELDSFRVAGGIMLFLIALDMVFEKRTRRREDRAEKVGETPRSRTSRCSRWPCRCSPAPARSPRSCCSPARPRVLRGTLVVLAALLAVLVLTLLALWAASPLMKLVGAQVEAVITRLLGVLLAALAAQYVFDGVQRQLHPDLPGGE